jgi:transmembrane sensor
MASDSDEKVVPLPSAQQIEADAATWHTVLGREHVSSEERAEFHRWLRHSERHRSAFKELSTLWGDLRILEELNDIGAATASPPAQRTLLPRGRLFVAAAASLAIAVLAGGGLYFAHLRSLQQVEAFATVVGAQRTVDLSDGSVVQLNTDTRVDVSFSRAERLVRLTRGEAYFQVAKDSDRPFIVEAGSRMVRAVGTAFTVRRRSNDVIEVTVEEGTVALGSVAEGGAAATVGKEMPIDRTSLAQLTAGQAAVFDLHVDDVALVPEPELKRKLAWRQGVLVYSGEPLEDVVADVSRYTDIRIEIADPALKTRSVAGYFPVGRIDGFLQSLELNFGIRVERVSATHVRLSS